MAYVELGATQPMWAPGIPARPLLKRGSKGSSVGYAQRLLNDWFKKTNIGVSVAVDNDFGRNTQDAVKQFQMNNKDASGQPLKVDGEIGRRTWSALIPLSFVPASTLTSSPQPSVSMENGLPEGPMPKPQMQVSGGIPLWIWAALGVGGVLVATRMKKEK